MIALSYGTRDKAIAFYFTNRLGLNVERGSIENFDPRTINLPRLDNYTHRLYRIREIEERNIEVKGDISDYVPLPAWADPSDRPKIIQLWQQLGRVPTEQEFQQQ